MNEELKQIFGTYKRICKGASDSKSLTVRELRKEYGIAKRDLLVLIEFFYTYYYFFDDYAFEFELLDGNKEGIKTKVEIDSIEDVKVAIEEIKKRISDDWSIYINDCVEFSYVDKFSTDKPLIILEEHEKTVEEQLSDICDVDIELLSIIDKNKLQEKILKLKTIIISAILNEKRIEIITKTSFGIGKKKIMEPCGLYYDSFLRKYFCICIDEYHIEQEIDLEDVANVKITNQSVHWKVNFDIDEYINKQQQCDMVIRVYKEGNVQKKLKELLCHNQLSIQEKEEFNVYSFKVSDEWLYAEKLKQYGKSVIIEKPQNVQQCEISDIQDAMELYKKLCSK